MAVQWTPDLAVGVREIDDQHRELFKRVNDLLEAMSKGKGRDEIAKVVAFLGNYVVTHFE
ncbi:MAG: hemerythrin domain-containing protein, partial [Armatimonadota bacterium]